MALEWKDSLATGVDKVDSQHRELFKRINSLQAAMKDKRGAEEVEEVMDFLSEYVQAHFATEERYMEEHAYPGYEEHRALHEKFKEEFGELRRKLDEKGAGFFTVVSTSQLVSNWWINHIMNVDKLLGDFLSDKV